MSDENELNQTEEVQEETVEEETSPEIEETPQETEEKEKEGLFAKLKNIVSGGKEEQEEEAVEEDIDSAFTEAARKAGWSDDQIVKVAAGLTNEQLRQAIPSISSAEPEEIKEEEKEELSVPDDIDDKLKPFVQQITEALDAKYQEEINSLKESLGQVEQDKFIKEHVNRANSADSFFDKVSEDFPVFGKTEELMRFPDGTPNAGQVVPVGQAFEARNEVWKTACMFENTGMPFKEALTEAFNWFKGRGMEKEIHKQVVKDLKRNEQRLSPRRSSKETAKKYGSASEEAADVVLQAARAAGVNV